MIHPKKKKRIYLIILCIFCLPFCLGGCQKERTSSEFRLSDTSIFSWEPEYLLPEYEEDISRVMEALECKAIYQEIPPDMDDGIVEDFIRRRREQGQAVYYLTGSREWGLEEGAVSMLSKVETVIEWNKNTDGAGFTGIVFDVESFLTGKWQRNEKKALRAYVDNCITAYDFAKENQIPIIICIPYYYDEVGYEQELERLIHYACDGVAVMNYHKADEWGQIAFEVEQAEKYGKTVIHITEVQRPGFHGLTETNTYYHDGIEVVKESWEALREHSDYAEFGFSWHYLRPILEIMETEEAD